MSKGVLTETGLGGWLQTHLGGVPREFLAKFVGEADIVRLQPLGGVGLGVGQQDRRKRLSGGRVGLVVHAGDAGTERDREGRLDVRDLKVVEHDRLRSKE